jgi:hypothetical protein
MGLQSAIRSLLVLSLIFAAATPVFANSLANWIMVWPGVVSIDPVFGLLPTVLVSFIERPFVSKAGVRKRPLLQSIRANLLSLLAGIPVAAFVYSLEGQQGATILAIVAVTVSIVVEGSYLSAVLNGEPQQLRWSWIVLGNIVSNSVLIGIALVVRTLNTTRNSERRSPPISQRSCRCTWRLVLPPLQQPLANPYLGFHGPYCGFRGLC